MQTAVPLKRPVLATLAAAAVLLAGALLGAPRVDRADGAPSDCDPNATRPLGDLTAIELKGAMVCLINDYRPNHPPPPPALLPFNWSTQLNKSAAAHNADMQNNLHKLTHAASNGDTLAERIRRYGYLTGASRWRVAEIIAQGIGDRTPYTILYNTWLDSPTHASILNNPVYKDFGVAAREGTVRNPNYPAGLYTVQFGCRNTAGC